MICWKHYPINTKIPDFLLNIVKVFEKHELEISSEKYFLDNSLDSNKVLEKITNSLQELDFQVETSKKKADKIKVPVTYKEQGEIDLCFEADAFHSKNKIVLEVEAGRGVANNQFLKDLFQACMMEDVEYLCIAIRKTYSTKISKTGKISISKDYNIVISFFDALYASNRLTLPFKGILVIGY